MQVGNSEPPFTWGSVILVEISSHSCARLLEPEAWVAAALGLLVQSLVNYYLLSVTSLPQGLQASSSKGTGVDSWCTLSWAALPEGEEV